MDVVPVIDIVGGIVGVIALLLATYSLQRKYHKYDETYIGVMYLMGVLLIFIAVERPIQHELTSDSVAVVFGRVVIYSTVAYWEYSVVKGIQQWR